MCHLFSSFDFDHIIAHKVSSITVPVSILWVLCPIILFGATRWGRKVVKRQELSKADMFRFSAFVFFCFFMRIFADVWIYVGFKCKFDTLPYPTSPDQMKKSDIIIEMLLSLLGVICYPSELALACLSLGMALSK